MLLIVVVVDARCLEVGKLCCGKARSAQSKLLILGLRTISILYAYRLGRME